MSISRHIVAATLKCSCACSGSPARLVELAQAQVTVGDERAHSELLGERERVSVVGLGVLRGIAAGGDV